VQWTALQGILNASGMPLDFLKTQGSTACGGGAPVVQSVVVKAGGVAVAYSSTMQLDGMGYLQRNSQRLNEPGFAEQLDASLEKRAQHLPPLLHVLHQRGSPGAQRHLQIWQSALGAIHSSAMSNLDSCGPTGYPQDRTRHWDAEVGAAETALTDAEAYLRSH